MQLVTKPVLYLAPGRAVLPFSLIGFGPGISIKIPASIGNQTFFRFSAGMTVYRFSIQSQVIQPGQQPMNAIWSVIPVNGKYQITNLTVAGINLALTQEADFKSVIQRQGFDALVAFMKSRG